MSDTKTDALKEYQEGLREIGQHVVLRALTRLSEQVELTDDPEFLLKVVNGKITDIAQALPEKKSDPNANLPTFHITLINGTAQVTAQPAPLVEVVQEVQPAPLLDDKPTPLMLTQASVNDDLMALFEDMP